ncbi:MULTISPECIES: hypothetical protein [Agrobacterium]|uniref:Uncharacterized protein n=1 Tax=Agrobacterium tumefaciens TaxID=358 RepID=A0AAW8M2A6_AGRTU|nr:MULTISPECIES: hypothetical protein [Agrobacterium]MBP2568518.1 hypothetical protein [Agrobacterium tumefaciens]MDR6705346.1 hypothetical protein [Agrobacterium tumefaciens]
MRDNVDAADVYAPFSLEETETGRVTSSIFEDQKELLNTVERDGIPEYLKSYQKAQAAALLSHSASACFSCKSCARVRACAPASGVRSVPRKMTSIFKLLANRLRRLGRKTPSEFGDMPAATNEPSGYGTAIAIARRGATPPESDTETLHQWKRRHR